MYEKQRSFYVSFYGILNSIMKLEILKILEIYQKNQIIYFSIQKTQY